MNPVHLYDVELVRIDLAQQLLFFDAAGVVIALKTACVSAWAAGAIGCLTLRGMDQFQFRIYADPRLRRFAALDDPTADQWGWTLGELRLQVRAGIIPGLNGRVIRANVKPVRIEVPREFIDLCRRHAVTPAMALRGFIADVCSLHNFIREPREDGYSSQGSDERLLAEQYWDCAHAWRRDCPPFTLSTEDAQGTD